MYDPLRDANSTWAAVFAGGPYTSYQMLDYLLVKADTSFETIWKNPRYLTGVGSLALENDRLNDELFRLWSSRTGRCTSFAIKVITQLENAHRDVWAFDVYDLHGHRVARCRRTGILIDSSSLHGAFRLEEGEWQSFDDSLPSWKWIKGKSKFEGARGGMKVSAEPVSRTTAMITCLKEVAVQTPAVTLFRSIENGRPTYHGLMTWSWKNKMLKLVSMVSATDRAVHAVILWGKKGTEEDQLRCTVAIATFLTTICGKNWKMQWEADGTNEIHDKIWQAANVSWGFPVLQRAA